MKETRRIGFFRLRLIDRKMANALAIKIDRDRERLSIRSLLIRNKRIRVFDSNTKLGSLGFQFQLGNKVNNPRRRRVERRRLLRLVLLSFSFLNIFLIISWKIIFSNYSKTFNQAKKLFLLNKLSTLYSFSDFFKRILHIYSKNIKFWLNVKKYH